MTIFCKAWGWCWNCENPSGWAAVCETLGSAAQSDTNNHVWHPFKVTPIPSSSSLWCPQSKLQLVIYIPSALLKFVSCCRINGQFVYFIYKHLSIKWAIGHCLMATLWTSTLSSVAVWSNWRHLKAWKHSCMWVFTPGRAAVWYWCAVFQKQPLKATSQSWRGRG